MPAVNAHDSAANALAADIARRFSGGDCLAVTWLNHHSALKVLAERAEVLRSVDVIGVDGKLLELLLGGSNRTSADLVIPRLLPLCPPLRVTLVGGSHETLELRKRAFDRLLRRADEVVLAFDGYSGLPAPERFEEAVAASRSNFVVVGLGAGLQEEYVLAARRGFVQSGGVALTCGGFLDQIMQGSYYPRWAYPLRLNWLVRLLREPRRLWRRYSVDALTALRRRSQIKKALEPLPSLWH